LVVELLVNSTAAHEQVVFAFIDQLDTNNKSEVFIIKSHDQLHGVIV
jgi:hypothetical protein